jgi:ribulose-5-phosphate 4-epimerase/fuculose-1-phosphate aldolase
MSQYSREREEVVNTCHTLLQRGYLKATEGNISVRVKGENAFAITPSNYDYAKMTAEDICVLGYERNVLTGTMKPSIESGMHAEVYLTRPDVHAIIHTHQPYASALALIKMPIPALFDEQVLFLGKSVDIVPYAPSGTKFLSGKVGKQVKSGNNAFILQNHGVLVLAVSTERAIHNMALLEKCALTYLLALLTEKKVYKIPLPIREIAFAKLKADEKKFVEN